MAFINQIRLITLVCVGLYGLSACNASFMKASPRSKTTSLVDLTTTVDAAGNVSAAFDPNSKSTQVLRLTTGALAGSGVALPPGALSIPVSITVGEGETLASSGFTQQLGLGSNAITAAGPSVSFIPSTNVQANSPFTLSIPFTHTSLTLDDATYNSDNLVILYRWMKVNGDDVSYEMGIIPRDEVTVSSSKVSFDTTKFGVFQIGISETKIENTITVPTEEPPSMKADASNPLVGVWGQCHEEGITPAKKEAPVNTTVGNTTVGNTTGGSTDTTTSGTATTGGTTAGGTPIVPSPNELQVPATCSSVSLYMTPYINKKYYPEGTMFTMKLSINSAPQTTTNMNSFSAANHGQQTLMFTLTKGSNYYENTTLTAWAPDGCHFEDSSQTPLQESSMTTKGSSLALAIGANMLINGPDCTGNTKIVCDGNGRASLTSDSAPADPHKTGGKAGDAPFGYVKDKSYFAYDVAKFTSSTFTHIKQTFDGDNCTGNLVSTMTETGAYALQPVDVAGTMPINLIKNSKIGTIYSDASIAAANNDPVSNGCGFSDWVAGTQKDLVSSTSCSSPRTTDYSRIKIDGGKMYFCDHGATATAGTDYGSSPANRAPDCSNITVGDFLQKN